MARSSRKRSAPRVVEVVSSPVDDEESQLSVEDLEADVRQAIQRMEAESIALQGAPVIHRIMQEVVETLQPEEDISALLPSTSTGLTANPGMSQGYSCWHTCTVGMHRWAGPRCQDASTKMCPEHTLKLEARQPTNGVITPEKPKVMVSKTPKPVPAAPYTGPCLRPSCAGTVMRRGLCQEDWLFVSDCVRTGFVTWEQLEQTGKVLPSTRPVINTYPEALKQEKRAWLFGA